MIMYKQQVKLTKSDDRNIDDKYKWWTRLDIKEDLASKAIPVMLILNNFIGDLNIGSAIRNGNAFNVKKIVIVGRRRIDIRSTVGAHHYMEIIKAPTLDDVDLEDYTLIGAEITNDSIPLPSFVWPAKTAIMFGEESQGLSSEDLGRCAKVVHVPQSGSVRSLNVANVSGMFCYDWIAKHGEY